MKRELRELIWNKYEKHCAYCGKTIEYKDMQVDHVFPQARKHWLESEKMRIIENIKDSDINHIDNLMPSCRMCNHYKRAMSLEFYREQLKTLHERLIKPYINRVGIDYKVIQIKPFDGIFYFEKKIK